MIKHLTSQGHDVTVASLVRSNEEAREGEGLGDYCAQYLMERVSNISAMTRTLVCLPSRTPSSMGYFDSPRLKRRISAVLKADRFDLIFVHCSSVAPYVEDVPGIPKMLDFGDMDSQKWLAYSKKRRFPLSVGYKIEGTKLQQAEMALATKFDYCTCTTRAELETLQSYNINVPTGWFPNGVDTEYFYPVEKRYDRNTICFIGRMDYYPNQQGMYFFCNRVMPLIRAEQPEAKLLIVGANPSRAVRRLGNLPGVTVLGSVPDVRPHLVKSALTVVPLKIARGTQNKILESMAMGVPVVASPQSTKTQSSDLCRTVMSVPILVARDVSACLQHIVGKPL
jgi:sugar transferase (PEP-CTERM/EpsH1 system associated)